MRFQVGAYCWQFRFGVGANLKARKAAVFDERSKTRSRCVGAIADDAFAAFRSKCLPCAGLFPGAGRVSGGKVPAAGFVIKGMFREQSV